MTRKRYAIVLLPMLMMRMEGQSQAISPLAEGTRHVIYLNTGFDQALIKTTLGYQTRIGQKSTLIHLDFSFLPPKSLLFNHQFRAGVQYTLIQAGAFRVPIRLQSSVSTAKNPAYRGVNVSSDVAVLPQFNVKRHTLGAEASYKRGWLTHVLHTEAYKAYYPQVVDGWYKSPSAPYRLGLLYGYQLGSLELGVSGGYQHNGKWDRYLPTLYGIFSANYRF
jgi:hypothetical protein